MPRFEERLIALRKERNLTQEELANKIGLPLRVFLNGKPVKVCRISTSSLL